MTKSVRSRRIRLAFPNASRSFDNKKDRIRFWVYDSAIEISFFVEADALRKLSPEMHVAEAGLFKAFNSARDRIHQMADKVYLRDHKDTYAYALVAEDFC